MSVVPFLQTAAFAVVNVGIRRLEEGSSWSKAVVDAQERSLGPWPLHYTLWNVFLLFYYFKYPLFEPSFWSLISTFDAPFRVEKEKPFVIYSAPVVSSTFVHCRRMGTPKQLECC